MSTAYWIGLATLPAICLAAFLIQVGLALLVRIGTGLTPGILRLKRDASVHQRARVAAVSFAAKRSWLVAFGEIGISLVIGQRDGARSEAYEALVPKVTLNKRFSHPTDTEENQ